MAAKSSNEIIDVIDVTRATVTYYILGMTPFIFHAFSVKAKRELLFPSGRKNNAERQQSTKHMPVDEFRSSVYGWPNDNMPTRLCFPSSGFKGAICTAALDMPGVFKSKLQKHIYVENEKTSIYGIPKLFMTPARSSDINHTPDIRTRALLPTWCAELTISYLQPYIQVKQLTALLNAAGLSVGAGDDRQEKGKGGYGQFRIVAQDDPQIINLMQNAGRAAQDEALELAAPYDQESEELLTWFLTEYYKRRENTQARVKLVS